MFVHTIPNRSSPPAALLRESYREAGKVKNRTLANLSHWPSGKVEALRRVLKGETFVEPAQAFTIERSLPHGHVAAVLGTLRQLGLERMLHTRESRTRDWVVAMIAARIIAPQSKCERSIRGILHSWLGYVGPGRPGQGVNQRSEVNDGQTAACGTGAALAERAASSAAERSERSWVL